MIRRRRPILRGAMVGGLGYMAGKAGANRAASAQEQRTASPEVGAPGGAEAPGGAAPSTLEQLKQLGELRDSGVLTPEEFEREKQKIMGGEAMR